MPKLMCNNLKRNNKMIKIKCFSPKIFTYKEEKNSYFLMNSWINKQQPNQLTEIHIIITKIYIVFPWYKRYIISVIIYQKGFVNIIMRKHQTNQSWVIFLGLLDSTLQQYQDCEGWRWRWTAELSVWRSRGDSEHSDIRFCNRDCQSTTLYKRLVYFFYNYIYAI